MNKTLIIEFIQFIIQIKAYYYYYNFANSSKVVVGVSIKNLRKASFFSICRRVGDITLTISQRRAF